MFYWLKRSSYTRIVILAALTLTLSACFGKPAFMVQPTEPPPVANRPSQANPASQHITESHSPQAAVVDVSYTLVTGVSGAQLVYIGQGGEIDGVVNPELIASPGDTVEIILINGDGAEHDIAVPELNAHSEHIVGRNSETTLVFEVNDAGEYDYYCTLPGHRAAGMEGKLVVGQVESAVDAPAAASIVKAPDDLPGSLPRRQPAQVVLELETVEIVAQLDGGATYEYWTFNGTVPGPFLRVRVGDTVEVRLKNAADSKNIHSVDFHAVTGPGGGAVMTQTAPGDETSFTFKALNPGLYVYHCATPSVAHHIANGMYGLILVEPEEGLAPVDREFYVMQGELYTQENFGSRGLLSFSYEKTLNEAPEFFVFNGAVGALSEGHALQANVGETVRIFFGVGGPNFISSFHVIGEIFDRVYDQASLTSSPLTDVQTTLVPPGGATMVEFLVDVPGNYILVDHALSRLERGLAGFLVVAGPDQPDIFHGTLTEGSGH
jgi:nitrite reductase (NO-forming)